MMYKYELYCGLKIGEDVIIEFINAYEFLIQEANKLKLDLTIIQTVGSYTNNNSVVIEDGLLAIILTKNSVKSLVKELIYKYKTEYKQESVLLVESKTALNAEFI